MPRLKMRKENRKQKTEKLEVGRRNAECGIRKEKKKTEKHRNAEFGMRKEKRIQSFECGMWEEKKKKKNKNLKSQIMTREVIGIKTG